MEALKKMVLAGFMVFSLSAVAGATEFKNAVPPVRVVSVTKSSQTANTTSVQVFAGNSARSAIDCATLAISTSNVYVAFGTVALATDFPIKSGSNWSSNPAAISTQAFHAITESSTQTIRCMEW